MKRFFMLIAIIIAVTAFQSCSKKGSGPDNDDEEKKELQKIEDLAATQLNLSSQLEQMLTTMDTTVAIDSVFEIARTDTANVANAHVSSQGVTIEYKNGMRGLIFVDPQDDAGSSAKIQTPATVGQTRSALGQSGWKPSSKKTKFLNPTHWERAQWADPLLQKSLGYFNEIGFNNFEQRFDDAANLAEFTSLSGYGIVHIYSHGAAWPTEKDIQEVYVLTGEVVNPQTNEMYLWDLQHSKIMVGTSHGQNRYWICPSFFAAHNDFREDTTLVYLGFCFSRCGNWQDTLLQVSKAAACVGFDWSVNTVWNTTWAEHLYYHMCDTSYARPWDLNTWRNADPCCDNTYWDGRPDSQKWVSVWVDGHSDLVLWSALKIHSLDPDSGAADSPVTIHGVGFGNTPGAGTVVTLNDIELELDPWTWTDSLIIAQIPIDASSGNIVVSISGVNSNPMYFKVLEPSYVLHGCHAIQKFSLYSPNVNDAPFEFTVDLIFGATVSGPGLATNIDELVIPYPDTEPNNLVESFSGSLGGTSPAPVTISYSLQTLVNDQDASSASPISLSKSYPNGGSWDVTITPVYAIEYWNNDEHPWWEETEIQPQQRHISLGNPEHLNIGRRLYIHSVFRTATGFEITEDASRSWTVAGFTLTHR